MMTPFHRILRSKSPLLHASEFFTFVFIILNNFPKAFRIFLFIFNERHHIQIIKNLIIKRKVDAFKTGILHETN